MYQVRWQKPTHTTGGTFLSNHNYTIAVSQKYLGHPPARLCRNADDERENKPKCNFFIFLSSPMGRRVGSELDDWLVISTYSSIFYVQPYLVGSLEHLDYFPIY